VAQSADDKTLNPWRARGTLSRQPLGARRRLREERRRLFILKLRESWRPPWWRLSAKWRQFREIPWNFDPPNPPLPFTGPCDIGARPYNHLHSQGRHQNAAYEVIRQCTCASVSNPTTNRRNLLARAYTAPEPSAYSLRCPFAATWQIRRTRSNPGRPDPPILHSYSILRIFRKEHLSIGHICVPMFLDRAPFLATTVDCPKPAHVPKLDRTCQNWPGSGK
jgi:hypothetical protein